MKKTMYTSILLSLLMLILPLTVIGSTGSETKTDAPILETVAPAAVKEFKILDTETEKITTLSCEDYIFGVLAAEMPALFEEEALKAQAVAAYTFARYKAEQNKDNAYDLTADFTTDQAFITKEKAVEKWGENAAAYTKKLEDVVKSVSLLRITYKGETINAVYHAASNGKTASSEEVWGKALPYLKSVESVGDTKYEHYRVEKKFTAAELKTLLAEKLEFEGDSPFGKIEKTESGLVKTIEICGKAISGNEVRSLLDLRSTTFEVSSCEDGFIFTTYGYGHGVGLSQHGANHLAKEGKTFKEILLHYYSGCKIEKEK